MTCANCGVTLTGSNRFCASCGAPVPVAQTSKKAGAPAGTSKTGTVAIPRVTEARSSEPRNSAPGVSGRSPDHDALRKAAPEKAKIDPLGTTAADAYADTAMNTPDEVERAMADRRAASRRATDAGVQPPAPAPGTIELESVPSPVAPSQLSPFAKSQFVPPQSQQMKTAALPAKVSGMPGTLPIAPVVPIAAGSSGAVAAQSTASPSSPRLTPAPPMPVTPMPATSGGPVAPLKTGSQVFVVWANGQRYRGTIRQIAGTRALVAFQDRQQHWVEMQYLSPA